MKRLISFIILLVFQNNIQAQTAAAIYRDPSQPVEERVKDLIGRLTLEEKAILLNHRGPVVERFGIKSDGWNQCLHGVWWNRPTTMFPVSIAMAATWNPKLINEVAGVISDEARAIYNGWHQDTAFQGEKKGLIYRAPVINISRNPYWGRINECYGEDPFLTGRIGVAFIKGLQGNDPKYLKLAATLKHYAVNNVERDRMKLSATVSERMLHEFWLPHFRDCIVEGGAYSVMASYNAINGVPNNINKMLLTDILKKQWGFKGFVVSDLGGVNTMVKGHEDGKMSFEDAVAKSILAGCDFSDKEFMEYIPVAVKKGLLTEEQVNQSLYRVLRTRFLLGEFDPPSMVPYSKIPFSVVGSEAHRQLALKTAQEAIVLLQNRNNALPIDKTKIRTIAVIGPHANIFTAGGYSGRVKDPVTPLQGIKNRIQPGTEVLYTAGAQIAPPRDSTAAPFNKEEELQKAIDMAKRSDVVILYVGTTLAIEAEGRDRRSLGLPGNQQELVMAVLAANPRTIIVEMNAGPLAIPEIKEKAPAILEAWWLGEEGGNAIADVLFGTVNPGGKLPLTVYASESQVPSVDEYDVTKGFTYMYLQGKPLFAFGHGLSYTVFDYSDLKISSKKVGINGTITLSVTVKNTGKLLPPLPRPSGRGRKSRPNIPRPEGRGNDATGIVKGDEVVQVYVQDVASSVKRPSKELRGFERISLNSGEKKTLTFTIPVEKLAFYDETTHGFVVEPGVFNIMVGSSSEDIRLQDKIEVIK